MVVRNYGEGAFARPRTPVMSGDSGGCGFAARWKREAHRHTAVATASPGAGEEDAGPRDHKREDLASRLRPAW